MGSTMREIQKGIVRQEGLIVAWQGDKAEKHTFIRFEDLIRMKINASDLVMNPKNYLIDEETMKISIVCRLERS